MTGAEGSHYGWYGVLAGASIVLFAFIGFDIVATTAEETKNPQRDVSRGILASLAIVTVLYVAVTVVLSGMVSYTKRATRGRRRTLQRRSPPTELTGPRSSSRSVHWPG
jgi:basic amino acid/polyamine antiporter, APA family